VIQLTQPQVEAIGRDLNAAIERGGRTDITVFVSTKEPPGLVLTVRGKTFPIRSQFVAFLVKELIEEPAK
jgi:hypothetical protein